MNPNPGLPGLKVLQMGAPGSGKTRSLTSWITGKPVLPPHLPQPSDRTGISAFGIFTEPGFDIVGDYKCPDLHWAYVSPTVEGWDEMLDTFGKINTLSKKTLAGMEWPNRQRYNKLLDVIRLMKSYKCDRCGQEFGSVEHWGTDRLLHLDSISGLNPMFLQMVVGGNPMRDVGEWGIAIDSEDKFISKLCVELRCHFQLVTHLDREMDQSVGALNIVPNALGNKLPTRIGRTFTDVILSKQVGGKFTWSTAQAGADLKARNFPLSDSLPADIGPALAAWKSRGGKIEPMQL